MAGGWVCQVLCVLCGGCALDECGCERRRGGEVNANEEEVEMGVTEEVWKTSSKPAEFEFADDRVWE